MKAILPITSTASRILAALRSLLDRANYFVQLVIFYLLSYALVVVYIPIAQVAELFDGKEPTAGPKQAFIAVAVAPLVETLVCQQLVHTVLIRIPFFQTHKWLIIFVSALLFGALHCYSVAYIAFAFTLGTLLMGIYMYYLPNRSKAFWSTAFVHLARNFTAIGLAKYVA